MEFMFTTRAEMGMISIDGLDGKMLVWMGYKVWRSWGNFWVLEVAGSEQANVVLTLPL